MLSPQHDILSVQMTVTDYILCFLPEHRTSSTCAQLDGQKDRPRGAGPPSPSSMSRVRATVASLSSASEGLAGDSTPSGSLRRQWPLRSPLRLGRVSRVYSRGLTFLDPGQGYLKEHDTEPKTWGLQSQLPRTEA